MPKSSKVHMPQIPAFRPLPTLVQHDAHSNPATPHPACFWGCLGAFGPAAPRVLWPAPPLLGVGLRPALVLHAKSTQESGAGVYGRPSLLPGCSSREELLRPRCLSPAGAFLTWCLHVVRSWCLVGYANGWVLAAGRRSPPASQKLLKIEILHRHIQWPAGTRSRCNKDVTCYNYRGKQPKTTNVMGQNTPRALLRPF